MASGAPLITSAPSFGPGRLEVRRLAGPHLEAEEVFFWPERLRGSALPLEVPVQCRDRIVDLFGMKSSLGFRLWLGQDCSSFLDSLLTNPSALRMLGSTPREDFFLIRRAAPPTAGTIEGPSDQISIGVQSSVGTPA